MIHLIDKQLIPTVLINRKLIDKRLIKLPKKQIEEGGDVLNVKKSYHEPATETTPEIPEREKIGLIYFI